MIDRDFIRINQQVKERLTKKKTCLVAAKDSYNIESWRNAVALLGEYMLKYPEDYETQADIAHILNKSHDVICKQR
jgi:hypothetical protein